MQLTRRQMMTAASAFLLASCRKSAFDRPLAFRPNVIVFLSDALRADYLGCYGCAHPVSPFLDRFRRESVFFEHCQAQGNWTRPSVASLFTGLMPRVHRATRSADSTVPGVEAEAYILRDRIPTLAEQLAEGGYATACFVANPHVQARMGFTRGFAHEVQETTMTPDAVVDALTGWLDARPGDPFFAYAHVFDPHGPYSHGREYFPRLTGVTEAAARARLSDADQQVIEDFRSIYQRKYNDEEAVHHLDRLSEAGIAHVRNLYAAEVRGVDAAFERLCGHLDRRGLLERTVVIFTADHGEAFREHGNYRHGDTLYNEETRVPLLMRLPGGRGRVVREPVGQFDIYPTLLRLAGLTPPEGIQARSVFNARGELAAPPGRAVFTDQDLNTPVDFAWGISAVSGTWKVMLDPRLDGVRGFDLAADPGEQHPTPAREADAPEPLRQLLGQLRTAKRRLWEQAEALGPAETNALTGEEEEALRAIGYL